MRVAHRQTDDTLHGLTERLRESFVDGNGNATFDAGEIFDDANGNGVHDADAGIAGVGGSGDVVVYRIAYPWQVMTPFAGHVIGQDGIFTIRVSIAVRNEPWETEGVPQ